jgi:hypothetical protein
MVAARRDMRRRILGRVALLPAVALVGCWSPFAPTIRDLNLRPEKHYQEKVSITGRLMRTQDVAGDTLLEIADQRDSRILVRVSRPVDASIGDWIRVTGVYVPEAQVGDTVLYDVLIAEDVSRSSAPWIPDMM